MSLTSSPDAPRRRFLVLVRAGRNALHLAWTLPADRQWDLITLAYDEHLLQGADAAVGTLGDAVVDSRGEPAKFFGISDFMARTPSAWTYEAFLMPDDDLLMDPQQINGMFELFMASGAALAQPALTWDSFYSHFVTLQNQAFTFRRTNFVEVMTPIMTRDMLRWMMPSFKATKSSWGLDYLWARFCEDNGRPVVILDAFPVKHTRPVGGGGLYAALGVDPGAEMNALLKHFGITAPPGKVYGGELAPGFELPSSGNLMDSLIAGMPPNLRDEPGFKSLVLASSPHLGQPQGVKTH